MPRYDWLDELRDCWLPNFSDAALARIADLVRSRSRFLIAGRFDGAAGLGCLATHAGWHHPETAALADDAGIVWLSRLAGLNPATSLVMLAWDADWATDEPFREALAAELHGETERRRRLR